MISENMYLQYFCGLTSFQTQAPFHPTVFVDIRKRMGSSDFDLWNALIIQKTDDLKPTKKKMITPKDDDNNQKGLPTNKGTLKIDATVANHKIVFPTDAGLLNTARIETERFIDLLYKPSGLKKPRDYRRIARTQYLVFSKKRRKSKKEIRKFIRKHLGFVKRNLAYIEKLLDSIESIKRQEMLDGIFPIKNPYPSKFPLSKRDQKIYWVIQQIYVQKIICIKKKHIA